MVDISDAMDSGLAGIRISGSGVSRSAEFTAQELCGDGGGE